MKRFSQFVSEANEPTKVHVRLKNQDGHQVSIWQRGDKFGHDIIANGVNVSASHFIHSKDGHEGAHAEVKKIVQNFANGGGIARVRKELEHASKRPWMIQEEVQLDEAAQSAVHADIEKALPGSQGFQPRSAPQGLHPREGQARSARPAPQEADQGRLPHEPWSAQVLTRDRDLVPQDACSIPRPQC